MPMCPVTPDVTDLAAASRRRFLARLATVATGAAGGALGIPRLLLPTGAGAASEPPNAAAASVQRVADWDVPQGHFYTEAAPTGAPADAGYVVSDAGGVLLWRDYKNLGGPAQLGFPISSRYDNGGSTYQAMQASLLRWDADAGFADIFPIFWALAQLQMDDWLAARGIPQTAAELLEDPDLPAEARLAWLTHPVLRSAFLGPSQNAGIARFGLPMGEPERFGPYLAQRFEKAVLQLWLDDVPDQPAAGTVSLIQVGDLLAEAGLIPDDALAPQPAPAPRPITQTLPSPGQAPATSIVTPGAGKYIVVSLGRQWWYAYQDGRQLFSGPVTTGQPALSTPPGHFAVLSRHSPYTMVSPWPPSSAFYYPPSHMTYALQITGNGVFLHDAPWRPYYGPGTNFLHVDPDGVRRTGSHGCINLPYSAAAWLWTFAPIGTPVDVIP